jgi:transcriptional regulator GlxA family with amidase domain
MTARAPLCSFRRPLRARYQAVRRAIRYFEGLDHPITVPALAVAADVSERSLERGFQETAGITPRTFMRLDRMHRARQDLRVADALSSSVTNVAIQHGFTELGRFAVDYKRMFGESPSTTLRRAVRSRPKRLADALPESTNR